MVGVALGIVIYPCIETPNDVINSDWPAFATGAQLVIHDPSRLYDLDAQRAVEFQVTGGRTLITLGIKGILPFLAPAWVAVVAVPFDLFGTDIGGRLWILVGLACLALGAYLAVRPRPPSEMLPVFASVPTALMMLNAQLDGMVALGIGGAIALWSRPYFAGLALGLTLMKPQLVLPLGVALLISRQWRVLAGWATAGVLLWASVAVLNPRWVFEWLAAAGTTVQPGAREVSLSHLGTLFPGGIQPFAVAVLSLSAIVAVVLLAWRSREDFHSAAALLLAGGVVASPHALPADLVLVGLALAVWGRARWNDWLLLSVGAALAAFLPAPWPTLAGVLPVAYLCWRISGWRPARAPASAG
jgi:hypothetical protein